MVVKGECRAMANWLGPRKDSWRRLAFRKLIAALLIAAWIRTGDCTGADEKIDYSTLHTPPSFNHEPNPPVLYFVVELADPAKIEEGGVAPSLKEKRLTCEASGYPPPSCEWKKNGEILDVHQPGSRFAQPEGFGSLTITNLQKSDEGTYQCFCKNDNGTAFDRPVELKQMFIEYFEHKTDVIEVELGKPFERKCTPPRSVPPARVYWIYMGAGHVRGQLTSFNSINSSHIAINDQGVIYLQYVKEENSPPNLLFTCTAENTELKDYKFGDQFGIKVLKKPGDALPNYIAPAEQYVSQREVTVLKGGTLELFCIFSGFPDQRPIWRKLEGEIDWTRVTFGTNFNKSMKIDSVVYEDAGTYECTFETDPVQTRRREFTVHVNAAPFWTEAPQVNVNSSESETVEFNCGAEGRPQPSFAFYKNGEELTADNTRVFIEGSKLKIVDLKKGENGQGDNAVYQCNATNEYGYVWSNFYLNLLSYRPILRQEPGNVVAAVGQTVKLTCNFFGSPRPVVQWSAPALLGARGHGPVDYEGNSSIHLYDVKKENEGEYGCFAENKHGNASGRGHLEVRDATELVNFPSDDTIIAGKPLRLPCAAKSDPKSESLEVTWFLYGQPIDASNPRYILEKDNTLRIESAVGTDSGDYTCVVKTDFDEVNTTAKIIVRDVPSPPQNVWVKCINASMSAEVMFHYIEMSKEMPAREFWVQYSMDENEPNYWETYPIPVSHLDKDFGKIYPNLHPYGNFAFRVVARNDVGDSAPTMGDRRCVTPAAKPFRNPAKVLVKGNTPEDLTVYWEPMQRRDWNGPEFEYVVRHKPSEASEEEYKEVVVSDPAENHLAIPVDQPYQSYDVMVKARNSEGDAVSQPSTTQGFSGEEKPDKAPTGFDYDPPSPNQPTVVTFKWDPYDAAGFKGVLKGFKIQHWHKTSKRAEPQYKEAYFDPSATRGTVYDLKPYSENYARILAYSGGGDGPASEVKIFTVPEGFPTPVQDLEAFALSHSEIGVIWKLPKEINGIFKGYNVTWCKVTPGTEYRIDFRTCNSSFVNSTTHYRILELTPNSTYRVEVACVTGAGIGEPNSGDVRTLPMGIPVVQPEKPSIHRAGIGEDHINITWLPGKFNPDDPKPVGNNHYVEYKQLGDQDWIKVPHEGGNFTVNVVGLQPGTDYEFRTVSVVDGNGTALETRSDVAVIRTAGEAPSTTTAGWLIAIIVAIIILIIILIIVCLVVRNRGAKYPVSEKEKEQGREPMLKEERGFGEYARPEPDEEKRSLTAESKPESETDSMAEYGDGETGRFTEDGSFIGQYGAPNKVQPAPGSGGDRGRTNLSTFV